MEKSYKAFAVVCILASLVLAVTISAQNAIFMASFANGDWLGIGLGACGICIDLGMFVFPTLAGLYYARGELIKAIAYGLLTIFCFSISIMSSWSHDLNKTNEIVNEAMNNSSTNTRQEKLFNTASDSIEKLKKDITTLKTNKQAEIEASTEGLRSQKSSLPRDYITQKNNIQTKIDKTAAETKQSIENEIAEKEALLEKKEADLKTANKGFDSVGKEVKTTKGAYSIAKQLSPENPDLAIGNITLIKGITLGIMAIAFSVAIGGFLGKGFNLHFPTPGPGGKKKKHDDTLSENSSQNLSSKSNLSKNLDPVTNHKLRVIKGTKYKKLSRKFDENVKAYIEAMEATQKNDICIGYQKIARLAGLTDNQAKEVVGHLKNIGMLKVVNGKTTIIREMSKKA